MMIRNHSKLVDLLQKAFSAEKAAAYAYIGHAGSLKDLVERKKVQEIEQDEWNHRVEVLKIMGQYEIPVSKFYEVKYNVIGRAIGLSCYLIGRFMPYFFAGKLESGNVCEYFVMMRYFHSIGIREHDEALYEMGIKEKEHEVHFMNVIRNERWLPVFEKLFSWGVGASANDVNLEAKYPVIRSDEYCPNYKSDRSEVADG